MPSNVTYRVLSSAADLRQVVGLQHLIWGEHPEVVIPIHMLFSLAHNGCPIIGAFAGELLVGFSIGFLGTDEPNSNRPALANLKLASKRLAVHPDYRSSGIGMALKLEQKNFANRQGIRLVTWTFDPLISRNAYFHLHKLGAVARRFYPDYYEDIPGQIDSIRRSDRMICEWWITSNRVEGRLQGSQPPLGVEKYIEGNAPIINPTHAPGGRPLPFEGEVQLSDSLLQLVEIPADNMLLHNDAGLAEAWRDHTRVAFKFLFDAGYVATDFVHEVYEGRRRSFYVMSFNGLEDAG